jgi:hypothetical protein
MDVVRKREEVLGEGMGHCLAHTEHLVNLAIISINHIRHLYFIFYLIAFVTLPNAY